MVKILGVSGTLVGSKTRILTEVLLNEVKNKYPEFEVEMIDLKDFQLDFCDGRPLSNYNYDTQAITAKFENADGYIIGTTILHGSIPGALKNLFDVIPMTIFEGKTIALAATGGNSEHKHAVEKHLTPIIHYLKMNTVPDYVFATSSDFNTQNEWTNPEMRYQTLNLVREFGEMCKQKVLKN